MKKTIKLWAAALCTVLGIASCKESIPQTISLSESIVEFSAAASTKTVEVTSNADWTVAEDADWLTVTPSEATGDQTVEITVTLNEAEDGKCAEAREATVTFAVSDITVAPVTVTVRQSAEEEVFTVTSSVENTTFDWKGGSFEFTVEYNMPYEAASSAEWLSVEKTKAAASDSYSVTVPVNEANSDRTATITIAATDGSEKYTVEVKQTAKPEPQPLPSKASALSGEFTVSKWGRKVKFSPANLYWDGIEFAFEDKQTAGATVWNPEHVSHFYWSATAANAIAETYVYDGTDYATAKFFADGLSEDWRTLSSDEFEYLINNHQVNRQVAIDGNMAGLVIAPDGVTTAIPSSYTASEWAAAEQAGYVLFPAYAQREGNKVDQLDFRFGYYWGSTNYGGKDQYTSFWYCTDKYGNYAVTTENASIGQSVRLVTVSAEEQKPEPLSGKFTVNAEGKQVQFSKGNLYWNGNDFAFEANQYDFPTEWKEDHVGHFTWNTTPANSYASEYKADWSDASTAKFFANDASVIDSDWTVLTNSEWNYILSNSTKSYKCTVNGVVCLVIAPDGFTGTLTSSYDETTWAAAQEQGVVAIPCCGLRSGTTITSGNPSGTSYYWTPDLMAATETDTTFYVLRLFARSSAYGNSVSAGYYCTSAYGLGVRLVKEVK